MKRDDVLVEIVTALKESDVIQPHLSPGDEGIVTDGPPELNQSGHSIVVCVHIVTDSTTSMREDTQGSYLVQISAQVSEDWYDRYGYTDMIALLGDVGDVASVSRYNTELESSAISDGIEGGSDGLNIGDGARMIANRWRYRSIR